MNINQIKMSQESSEIDDISKNGKVSSDLELTETNKKKTDQKAGGNGKYPKVVFLIILNELCERFSFYGLRTVLYIFFSGFIKLSESTSTALYHAYTMLCYFSPILGKFCRISNELYISKTTRNKI